MTLLWNMLFGGQDAIGLGINVFIAVLFTIGFRDILRGRRAIARERLLVSRARKVLGQNKENQMAPSDSSGRAVLQLLNTPDNSLLGHRILRMMQLRAVGLGSRDVLQQVTSEQVGSYGALARQIGSTLTLVGLLGTVFGLSLALVNIGDASAGIKGVDDLEKLSRALAGTMGGMKTAFGCTMAGLISAVLLSFLNHLLRREQSLASSEIEEFLLCDLLPAMSQYDSDADTASKSFAEVLIKASGQIESLTKNVSQAAGEFHAASSEFRQTFVEMAAAVAGCAREMTEATASNNRIKQFILEYHDEYKVFVTNSAEAFRRALLSAVEAQSERNSLQLNGILQKSLEGLNKVVAQHQDVMHTVSDMVLDVQLNGRAKSAANGGRG